MKPIFLLFFLATFGQIGAQFIEDDQTKVLDKIQGEPLFELDENVEVFSFQPEDGWYKIRRAIYLNPGEVSEEKILPEGTILKDKEGNEIGLVLREMEIAESKIPEKYRGKKSVMAIVEGWVFKTKFQKNSMPETRVSELLEIKNRTEQQAGFSELFSLYEFEEREFGELTAFTMLERQKTVADEKDFRMVVVFRGETPYAILSKGHNNVTAEKVKFVSENGEFRTIYFYKPSASQQEIVEDQILYTYLAL